jgi:hypothetical protein
MAEGRLLSYEILKVFCFDDVAGLGTFYTGRRLLSPGLLTMYPRKDIDEL